MIALRHRSPPPPRGGRGAALAGAARTLGLGGGTLRMRGRFLLPALRKLGSRLRPHFRRHPELARIARFVGASLVGIVVVRFDLLVETRLASRSGDGAATAILGSAVWAAPPLAAVVSGTGVVLVFALGAVISSRAAPALDIREALALFEKLRFEKPWVRNLLRQPPGAPKQPPPGGRQ